MFMIGKSDLELRRKACQPVTERLLKDPREQVTECNLCGSERNVLLAARDRYRLPVRTAMCLDCGLVYLVDRFTASSYETFYGSGAYRDVSSLFLRSTHSIEHVQADQENYAAQLIETIRGYVPARPGAKLLDIGGSAGAIAASVGRHFQLEPTVLDPATDEADAARRLGVRAVTGSLETWNTDERFSLILLCRSIEHLMDLKESLRKVRELLTPDGLFYCDLAEFMETCRLVGPPQAVSKIDHCYWLTQESAAGIFASMGLEIVSMNLMWGFGQVGFLLRKCEPAMQPLRAAPWVPAQMREIQSIETSWLAEDQQAVTPYERVRRRAYRIKRNLMKLTKPEAGRPPAEAPAKVPQT